MIIFAAASALDGRLVKCYVHDSHQAPSLSRATILISREILDA